VHLEDLWSEDGPSPEGLAFRNRARELSPDSRLLLMAAWAFWNGTQSVTLADLLELDSEHLCVVGELLAALTRGPREIDGWLAHWARSRDCRRARSGVASHPAG
jgi:hypothetical protein